MDGNVLIFTSQQGEEYWKSVSTEGYDLIVFKGGYFASIYLSDQSLIKQFIDIVEFKIQNSNVVILLNNDDLQYINQNKLSGYRESGAIEFKQVLEKYREHWHTEYTCDYGHFVGDEKLPIKGYFINDEFHEFEQLKTYQHTSHPEISFNFIGEYRVGIFIPFMENVDPKMVEAQASVFKTFGANINQVFWKGFGGHPHAEFVNHIVNTIDCDFYVLFDIDSIPLKPDFLQILIDRAGKDKLVGAEQTFDSISDIPFAAPSCFCISKDLYNKMGRPSFDPTHRSDDTQELTHLAWEQGIEVDFIRFSHCKIPNYYWNFEDGRQYGFGSYYEDLVYHNFQARFDRFTQFFYEECEKIVKKYS